MNNTFSIMPKILKKGLLYFSFAVLGLVIAGFMLPYLYKDKIITFIKEKTNQNLHAEVDFSDANISFFKSFPDVRITIDSLSVMGIDTFDGITLYKSLSTSLEINIPSLLGKEKIPKNKIIRVQFSEPMNPIMISGKTNGLDHTSFTNILLNTVKLLDKTN